MPLGLKTLAKQVAHLVLQRGSETPSTITVLGGPLKGVRLNLDLRSQSSYWWGNYDSWILDRVPLQLLIKAGDTAWDGGSFVGFYAALFRKYVGDTGWVDVFEASPINYTALAPIGANNGWNNVAVHELAIGPDHSTISFAAAEGGASGPVNLVEGMNAHRTEVVSVRSCGVDELIEEVGLKAPDFIKFDLETGEIFALKNGKNLYSRHRPIVLLELHGIECQQAALTFANEFDYYLTDIWGLPTTANGTAFDASAWCAAYRAASEAFTSNPPASAPHMTLAIPKDRLDGLVSSRV